MRGITEKAWRPSAAMGRGDPPCSGKQPIDGEDIRMTWIGSPDVGIQDPASELTQTYRTWSTLPSRYQSSLLSPKLCSSLSLLPEVSFPGTFHNQLTL